jgi:hypothetical protein
MKSLVVFPAAALLLALAASPAFAGARYDSRAPDAAPVVAQQDAPSPDAASRAAYGANAAPRAEAGSRTTLHVARDPFTINGRSLYDQP